MQPIVSYSFFRSPTSVYEKEKGDAALQFEQFLPMLIRGHFCVWSGFTLLIHVDDHVKTLPYWPALPRMRERGLLQICECGPSEALCKSMLWRLTPAMQGQDKIVVCRDIDSIPMYRDRMAVEEWMRSPRAVHVIHDNQAHSGVMGGTLAVKSHRFQKLISCASMEELLAKGADLDWKTQGADQHLLNRLLPAYAHETLVHQLVPKPVTDMGKVEVRPAIMDDLIKFKLPHQIRTESDKLCFIGGCTEPKPALDFFNSISFPEKSIIEECERG